MKLISVSEKLPDVDGFYATNVGVLHFEGVWTTPEQYQGWEPDQHNEVTHWLDTPQTLDNITNCNWIRKPDGSLQLQASIWWLACVSKSELKDGLFYWKARVCPETFSGYAESENAAVTVIEALIKTDVSYLYNLTNSVKP